MENERRTVEKMEVTETYALKKSNRSSTELGTNKKNNMNLKGTRNLVGTRTTVGRGKIIEKKKVKLIPLETYK